MPARAATFNAADYGARGDDNTDNTAAFSKCMEAIVAAGGGRMILPDGVYRGRIIIPPVHKPTPSWITVEIVGESEPPPVFGTLGKFPLQNHGTIVKCLAKEGAAVISAARPPAGQDLYGGFSAVYVVLRNLDVRTYDDPAIGGVELANAMQCRLENVSINTGVYSVQASKPTHGAKGLVTPRNNNAALTLLRNVGVIGYHTGIEVNEHTDGDSIEVDANIHGLEFPFAHHASRLGRVCAQNNTHTITVTGPHGFSIQQLDIERATTKISTPKNAWQNGEDEVNDPGNLGIADINYWVVIGGVGARDVFIKNGGAKIRARRIGSATENANENAAADDATPKTIIASSAFDPAHGAEKACDGIVASSDVHNYWASANGQDVGSWWQVDLGETTNIAEVRVRFRSFDGLHHFVPGSITFQVSYNGQDWRTVISKSKDVPANSSADSGRFFPYPIKSEGRYVRLLFEDGTEDQIGRIKAVELVEVKVVKADGARGHVK